MSATKAHAQQMLKAHNQRPQLMVTRRVPSSVYPKPPPPPKTMEFIEWWEEHDLHLAGEIRRGEHG